MKGARQIDPNEPRSRRKARKAAVRKRETWMPAFEAVTRFNRDEHLRTRLKVRLHQAR